MPAPVQLPPDYYAQHFAEFLQRVDTQYLSLCGEAELAFIATYRG